MSINEAQRRQVYADLERALGPESAAIVMEQVFAVDWRDLARHSAMEARFALVDAQFVAVRGEMAEHRAAVLGDITELKAEMTEFRAEVKGDFAKLEARVDRQARTVAAINAVSVVAASMATAGLVLAATRLG
jgi:hypothetical protein